MKNDLNGLSENTEKKPPLILIAGPTAVGKTALSVRLAREIGGEIISADSMQVYRGMDIGTAKVTEKEKCGVPHYLIDILDPKDAFNIVRFQEGAREAMKEIRQNRHVPILVGGTGFYIQSVLYDIDFNQEADSAELRKALEKEMEERGEDAMHGELLSVDPASAAVIHKNNRKRVIRALEYYRLTGEPISRHNAAQHARKSPYNFLFYVLTMDRAALYARIDRRVDLMLEEGLLSEVKRLEEEGLTADLVSMQGLGYKELLSYLEGRCTYDDAVAAIKQETRHFAKRQLTWFKREPDARWISLEDYGFDSERICERIKKDCEEWFHGTERRTDTTL